MLLIFYLTLYTEKLFMVMEIIPIKSVASHHAHTRISCNLINKRNITAYSFPCGEKRHAFSDAHISPSIYRYIYKYIHILIHTNTYTYTDMYMHHAPLTHTH